jgi:primary-amine oxidase
MVRAIVSLRSSSWIGLLSSRSPRRQSSILGTNARTRHSRLVLVGQDPYSLCQDHANRRSMMLQVRSVWSTGQTPPETPSLSLSPNEVKRASQIVRDYLPGEPLRFMAITYQEEEADVTNRSAEVLVLNTTTGLARELSVDLVSNKVSSTVELPPGTQPFFTPEECDLAETIAKNSPELQSALRERYGITDMDRIAADPWSVNLASSDDIAMTINPDDGSPRRLVQTFLYQRVQGKDMEDNHYAHPIALVPVVDLIRGQVVKIDGLERLPAPPIPHGSVNYHRHLVNTNEYLAKEWRPTPLAALDITQPNGPSYTVTDGNFVTWQNWSFRVGFNYREGLVLHDVCFDGRSVLKRAALVEMAVPYGDPRPPYTRKCAFDVGDYGLGNCANSLELGCDCLGHIHYFDAVLNTTDGAPKILTKAVCMHEADNGLYVFYCYGCYCWLLWLVWCCACFCWPSWSSAGTTITI